jgi:endonuclease-3
MASGARRSGITPAPRGVRPYRAEEAFGLLAEVYGPLTWAPRMEPTAELVWTILSQHTSDLNAGRAFDALVARYPTWEGVEAADTRELARVIAHGGLANQKAPRIQAVLAALRERTGGYALDFLAQMPLADAKAWLTSLPGVGPKTAGVVLSFALGMPAMAVDTHIHRVAQRLRLIGPRVSADAAHDLLEQAMAPERVWAFHVYLITHGRRVCKAQRPLCHACPLAARCPSRRALETPGDDRVPDTTTAAKPL